MKKWTIAEFDHNKHFVRFVTEDFESESKPKGGHLIQVGDEYFRVLEFTLFARFMSSIMESIGYFEPRVILVRADHNAGYQSDTFGPDVER